MSPLLWTWLCWASSWRSSYFMIKIWSVQLLLSNLNKITQSPLSSPLWWTWSCWAPSRRSSWNWLIDESCWPLEAAWSAYHHPSPLSCMRCFFTSCEQVGMVNLALANLCRANLVKQSWKISKDLESPKTLVQCNCNAIDYQGVLNQVKSWIIKLAIFQLC